LLLRQQLPNLISIIRVVLTPFAVRAILAGQDSVAFWLCWLAGLTDFLDGGLARRLGVASKLGAIIDPLADKFMLDVLSLTFWLVRGEAAGLAVVARDVLIVGGALLIRALRGRTDFPPSWLGKWSTAIQMAWVLILLEPWATPARPWATMVMLAGTVISGLDYIRLGVNMMRAGRPTSN
jgi:cardiolipin synthase